MDARSKEIVRRWTPRLLGVAPLIMFCLGLFVQGGSFRGLAMAVLLLLLILTLLVLYVEVTHLVPPMQEPGNPLLLLLYRPFAKLISGTPSQTWPLRLFQDFLRAITASPYNGIASLVEDIEYTVEGHNETRLYLEERLNPGHPKGKDRQDSEQWRHHAWRLTEINGHELNSKQKQGRVEVEGGEVEWQSGSDQASGYTFVPNPSSAGCCLFMCRAAHPDQPQDCSFPVSVYIKPPASSMEPRQNLTAVGIITGYLQSILETGRAWMASLRWLLSYALQLRIQVVIVALCWLLFQTQQVRDVLLAMVLDHETKAFAWATIFGVALCLLLWHSSRQLTRMFPEIHLRRNRRRTLGASIAEHSRTEDKTASPGREPSINQGIFSQRFELFLFWLSWISIALFTVPIASEAFDVAGAAPWQYQLVGPYILFMIWAFFIGLWHFPNQPREKRRNYALTFIQLFLAGLLLPLLVPLIFRAAALTANTLPQYFGSIAVLFWALCMYLIVMTTIFRFSVASGFPLLSLLLVLAYLGNINRINDNHAIRYRPVPPREQQQKQYADFLSSKHDLPSIEQSFVAWLNAREGLMGKVNYSEGHPFPVYVISAQGGGIYAAYHTAMALARLSEEVCGFDQHIFAISSVSGGSMGSTIYSMALKNHGNACDASILPEAQAGNPKSREARLDERIESYFEQRDGLATILASLLFGDITQRFFPLVVSHWDRALGLELSFENRYSDPVMKSINGANVLMKPIRLDGSFYHDQDIRLRNPAAGRDPASRGLMPSQPDYHRFNLVLNTTEVENGRRFVLAPFSMSKPFTDADFHQPWREIPDRPDVRDLRFSTAAGLSARFPVVSPYGFFADNRKRRFVDGGLYDNSGAITAAEIMNNLNVYLAGRCRERLNGAVVPVPTAGVCELIRNKRIKVIPLAIVDKKAVELSSDYANPNFNTRGSFRLIGWTPVEAVLSTREARLQKATDQFLKDFSSEEGAQASGERRVLLQKDFRLGNDRHTIFSVPLGWNMSCQARAFINDQLQPRDPRKDGFHFLSIPCDVPQLNPRSPVVNKRDQSDDMRFAFPRLVEQLRQDIKPSSSAGPVQRAGS